MMIYLFIYLMFALWLQKSSPVLTAALARVPVLPGQPAMAPATPVFVDQARQKMPPPNCVVSVNSEILWFYSNKMLKFSLITKKKKSIYSKHRT